MPTIKDYISIPRAVIISGVTRSQILGLIENETIEVSTSIVTGRTMILKSSFNTWHNEYVLSQKSLTEVLSEGKEMVDGVQDYLVATLKQVTDVEFTDIDDDPRVLANATEFYQSVLDTATILVD